MRSLRRKQKTILAIVFALEFFIASAFSASARGGPSTTPQQIKSPSQVASELEARYNLDLGSLRNQGQSFNVSDNKKQPPEVSLFFNPSDPKPGEKLSAKAFPLRFANEESALYYTWYLKRKGCDLDNNVTDEATLDLCNASDTKRGTDKRESTGDITVEDWKIEAARIIAQNGYEKQEPPAGTPLDDDGYKARFGGDNKTNAPDHCYVNDAKSGINYELTGSSSNTSQASTCPEGASPACVVDEGDEESGSGVVCSIYGAPACSATGTPICSVGTPRCVTDITPPNSCGTALTTCSSQTSSGAGTQCRHLFPNAKGAESGDGSFGKNEEEFWGTDPVDPDTADNGNKDEANVVGLGQSVFVWNYVSGDEVGVVIEGTSANPTKHDDSSHMIMWAFPKKNCPIELADGTGSYTKTIKGYAVEIPTASFDLNKCIPKNLVDPTKGGQATNLEVAVSATPNNPINDETEDQAGDIVITQATVTNAQRNLADILFDWKVEFSKNINFDNAADITKELREAGLLGSIRGNALDSIRVKLDAPEDITSKYLIGGVGYLRFKVTVTENFGDDNIVRKGRGDVIVKFVSTKKKISAYKANTVLLGGVMRVTLADNPSLICNNDSLDRTVCRVIKNEIIGLRIDPAGLSNFHWTINGQPLVCSKAGVSPDCETFDGVEKPGQQNEVNFFPITGNPGETYSITVTANDVNTGNILTLTRAFRVVEPAVAIESLDKSVVWPKFLGQYKDITGKADATACPDGLCNDYSKSIFQAFSGGVLGFHATFIPPFLGGTAQKEWTVDGGTVVEESAGELHFTASEPASGIYNISLIAQVVQSNDTRRALYDIWNVSPFDSPEINFSTVAQVELQEPGITGGALQGPRKYFAAIASYIPGSVIFTFRILLSAALVLFALNFLYALLRDRRTEAFVANLPEEKN